MYSKREAYEMMINEGLIVQEAPFSTLKTDDERKERIAKLVQEGFRLQKYGDKVCPINMNGSLSQEMEEELLAIYEWSKD
jgi:hypothetical protein